MPRNVLQFDVVISAPNDMIDDVTAIENYVKFINNTLEQRGISVKTRHWSYSTIPGSGSEGQEVVRRQLMQSCDILIAIIGQRLGTPTKEHESGTADEIMHMLDRDGGAFDGHHVQIYFKNVSINMNQLDITEIGRVLSFKEKIKAMGVLYGEYSSSGEIPSKIAPGISRAIENYMNNNGINNITIISQEIESENQIKSSENKCPANYEGAATSHTMEPGFLDLSIVFYTNFEKLSVKIDNCTTAINDMTELTELLTGELNTTSSPIQKMASSNRLADRMIVTANKINENLIGADIDLTDAISSLKQMVSKFYDPNNENDALELPNLLAMMAEMAKTSSETGASIKGLEDTAMNAPNISSRLTNSHRILAASLSNFGKFCDLSANLCNGAIDEIINATAV